MPVLPSGGPDDEERLRALRSVPEVLRHARRTDATVLLDEGCEAMTGGSTLIEDLARSLDAFNAELNNDSSGSMSQWQFEIFELSKVTGIALKLGRRGIEIDFEPRGKYATGANDRHHRDVVEEQLGRKLRSDEVVHHVNGDRGNNDPENLLVVNGSEHARLHAAINRVIGRSSGKLA